MATEPWDRPTKCSAVTDPREACARAMANSAPRREVAVPVTGAKIFRRGPTVSGRSMPRAMVMAHGPENDLGRARVKSFISFWAGNETLAGAPSKSQGRRRAKKLLPRPEPAMIGIPVMIPVVVIPGL
jgi:hypothetical protein